jgi:hypothetical protein
MAVNFDAILKIGAQVTGMGQVAQLGNEINKVLATAGPQPLKWRPGAQAQTACR